MGVAMSRVIKFRAWDEVSRVMRYPEIESGEDCPFKIDACGSVFYDETVVDYRTELMQYTGLTDKNGVEIYEGGIVTGINQYSEVGEYSGVVQYASVFAGYCIGDYVYTSFNTITNGLEVIGNIYENPELLGGKV